MAFGDHYLSQGATGPLSCFSLAAGGTVCAGMSGVTCYIIFFRWQGQGWQLSQHGHGTLGALAGVMRHVTGGPFRTAVNMVLTADSLHKKHWHIRLSEGMMQRHPWEACKQSCVGLVWYVVERMDFL